MSMFDIALYGKVLLKGSAMRILGITHLHQIKADLLFMWSYASHHSFHHIILERNNVTNAYLNCYMGLKGQYSSPSSSKCGVSLLGCCEYQLSTSYNLGFFNSQKTHL